MASKIARSFLTNFVLFLMFHVAVFVQGDECPQQAGGPSTTNERAAKLSGTGEFWIYGDKHEYKYTINLCKTNAINKIAIQQESVNTEKTYVVGWFNGSRVFGGTDWLMLEYFGKNYKSHCGGSRRKAIFYIMCDRSADTHSERTPKLVQEYRPDGPTKETKDFCYFLFEMKHDAACSSAKTKINSAAKTQISPGSFFLIMYVLRLLCSSNILQ